MKKYFVFLGIAAMTLAACTKTETIEAPAKKITFEVANYVPQTRNSSLESEGYEAFNTCAWFFPNATDAPQTYMDKVEIVKGTAWAPAEDYFWPKNGWINFYSYVGTKAPVIAQDANNPKKVTATYENAVIVAGDNYMIADPALHFTQNVNTITYDKKLGAFDYATGNYTYQTETDGAFKGVPTLFRHQLAKVAFVVKLKTTTEKVSASTTWTVKILGSGDYLSNIKPVNKGTLTLENTDAATTATQGSWTTTGWVASTAAADVETINFGTKTLTIQPNATESAEDDDKLVEVRAVMPQVTSGVKFNFSYEVSAKNSKGTYMTYKNTIDETTLAAAVPSITQWEMNKIYVYNIIIDPATERVTFDPAVVEWVAGGTGTINYPAVVTP